MRLQIKAYLAIVIGFVSFICADQCLAWEATHPSGPVKIDGLLKLLARHGVAPSITGLSSAGSNNIFGEQKIAYPQDDGVTLGTGWDYLQNKKTYSNCINFSEGNDKDQTANLTSSHAVDQETLDVSLNVSMSASVSGTVYAFKGSADGSFGLDGSYHYASKDEVYVAQASVTNGASYVKPPANGWKITLKPEMEKLRSGKDSDGEAFRKTCGDGFVASIVSGADLYLMFHFHDLTETDKISIQSSFKGSGGMGDLFKASASASSSTTIQKFYDENKLDLQFVQNGGKITSLPVDLVTAQAKVQALPTEAWGGPRPIYIVVVPYTVLPDVSPAQLFSTLDLKGKAARYLERLNSVYSEIMGIEDDYFRNRFILVTQPGNPPPSPAPTEDQYFYSYLHHLRPENISALHDDVLNEIKLVTTIVRDLNSPQCGGSTASASSSECDKIKPSKSADGIQCSQLPSNEPTCQRLIDRIKNAHEFDDYQWWIQLPLPVNSIPADVVQRILFADNAERQRLYAHYVFQHWIERFDEIRCGLFFECLRDTDKQRYLKAIFSSFKTVPSVFTQLSGLPGNIQHGVQVAPGFSVQISEGRVDSQWIKHDIYYQDLSPGSGGWLPLATNLDSRRGYAHSTEGDDQGFDIGVYGNLCYQFMVRPSCSIYSSSEAQTGPLTYVVRYYDPGETQATAWDLEVKIEAVPIPPFSLVPQ